MAAVTFALLLSYYSNRQTPQKLVSHVLVAAGSGSARRGAGELGCDKLAERDGGRGDGLR